jgi:hypothetical protein
VKPAFHFFFTLIVLFCVFLTSMSHASSEKISGSESSSHFFEASSEHPVPNEESPSESPHSCADLETSSEEEGDFFLVTTLGQPPLLLSTSTYALWKGDLWCEFHPNPFPKPPRTV